MYISRLALDHYRSWNGLVVDFTPGVNVLYGENGLGKTNIVEAVEVLSTGSSHRVSSSLPLVERGEAKATIRANVVEPAESGEPAATMTGEPGDADVRFAATASGAPSPAREARVTTYEATIAARGANRARVNSGPSRYLRDIVGLVPSVSFTPDDQRLVSGEPAGRRSFLDQAGALLVPRYADTVQRFTRIARQRAALLKQLGQREGSFDAALSGLEIWTGQFIEEGVALTRTRMRIVERLAGPFAELYGRLSGGRGEAALAYAPSFEEVPAADAMTANAVRPGASGVGMAPTDADPASIPSGVPASPGLASDPRPAISAHFQRLYAGEVSRGVNLIGPQRDDLAVTLDGVPAREFASNGEMWTMALALKMALFEAVSADRGVRPIVILDDVFAQLDESRRAQILDFAAHQDQVLVTAAAAGDIPDFAALSGGEGGDGQTHDADGTPVARRANIIAVASLIPHDGDRSGTGAGGTAVATDAAHGPSPNPGGGRSGNPDAAPGAEAAR